MSRTHAPGEKPHIIEVKVLFQLKSLIYFTNEFFSYLVNIEGGCSIFDINKNINLLFAKPI